MIPNVNKDYIKTQIDAARDQIGKYIHVYTPTRNACPVCLSGGFYDSKSDSSYNVKCSVCKGKYWLNQFEDHVVMARVHWTTNEAINITPGGRYFTGDAYAVVDPRYHDLMQQAQVDGKVVVDGQEMQIMRINPEGAPEINRYKVILRGMGGRPE